MDSSKERPCPKGTKKHGSHDEQPSAAPDKACGSSILGTTKASRLHTSQQRSGKHRSKHQHHRRHASSPKKPSASAGVASPKPSEEQGHRSPVFSEAVVVGEDAESPGPKIADTGTLTATSAGVPAPSESGAQVMPAGGPPLSAENDHRSPSPVSICSPPPSTTMSAAHDDHPIFQVRHLIEAGFERRADMTPEESALSPWTPDSVLSPVAHHLGRHILCDVVGQDTAETTLGHKSSVRFGGTTVREMSPHTTSLIVYPRMIVGLIAVVVAFCLVSTGVLIYIAGDKPSGQYFAECNSATCRRATRDIQTLMDYGTDPCRDFHHHVCHHWKKTSATPVTFLRYSTRQFLVHVNSSLSKVYSAKTVSTGFYNLAKFYRSCERFVSAPAVSVSDVLRPVQEYGEDILGLSAFPDVVRYVVELSLLHGIHTVLAIRLIRFPDGVFLRISRGSTLSQKMDAQPILPAEVYLEELLREISNMRNMEFNKTDIFYSDRSLSAIMASEGLEERKSAAVLAYLTTYVRQAEWLDALNAYLPEQYKLSRRSVISIDNVDLVQQLLSFFRGLVDYGVMYLYVHIILDAFRFDYLRRISRRDSERVVSSCLQATRLVMRNARNVIVAQLFPLQNEESAVREVLSGVLKAIIAGGTLTWMDELSRKRLRQGYVTSASTSSTPHTRTAHWRRRTLKKPPLPVVSRDSSFALRQQQQWSLLKDPPSVHEGDIDDAFLLGSEITYDDLSNRIIVPASLRREPVLYTGEVLPEFVMGTLGVLLARALLYAAFLANATSSGPPEEMPALVNFEQCMDEKARTALNVSLREGRNNALPQIYMWAQGVRSAFDALRAAYEQNLAAFDQGMLYWVAAQKTFFRRFCLLSCGVESEREDLTSKVSCFLPLLNMKEFSAAFNCEQALWLHSNNYCVV
ncbi:hypothetical protein HPB50_025970 [Hyalomma asiaticum]|uniref:Uncharacterized protein n=1 Tax=Hyalomma asiaticum TaxID=266040 RepID=A0ACB7T437_HYAAI|nr:hypothetical protein HPB50_025970 [Hyalomma asiaticum]